MDTKNRETQRETETESRRAKLNQESLHKCDFANASYFFKHHNQQVTNITKAIFVKTLNCITTNPLKTIRTCYRCHYFCESPFHRNKVNKEIIAALSLDAKYPSPLLPVLGC